MNADYALETSLHTGTDHPLAPQDQSGTRTISDDALVGSTTRTRAVYGEGYHQKKGKNVANYFFNEAEPNWHLDMSLLQYPSREANDPVFVEWTTQWKHLGTQALIMLWLLKTDQHAYNLRDSLVIEFPRF